MAVATPLVMPLDEPPDPFAAITASLTATNLDRDAILKEVRARQLAQKVGARRALLAWLNSCFDIAEHAKRSAGVTEDLEEASRRIQGRYSAARESELKKHGFPVYWFPVTASKVNACKAWRAEYKNAQAQGMFVLTPSAIPTLPPEDEASITDEIYRQAVAAVTSGEPIGVGDVLEMTRRMASYVQDALAAAARQRAKAMQRVIQDDFDDENISEVFDAASDDAIDFGTGIVKGPVVRTRKRERWDPMTGQKVMETVDVLTAYAVNPQDMFPAPWKTRENDGAWQIERMRVHRNCIADMKAGTYALPDEIDAFLRANPDGSKGQNYEDQQRDLNEKKDTSTNDGRQEVYEFHGMVPGTHLQHFDIADIDPNRDYSFIVTFSKTHVLEVRPNWDDGDREAYHWIPFKRLNGTIWGKGVPMLVKAPQDAANGAWVALLLNCQWSAKPIFFGDRDRVVDPNQLLTLVSGTTIVTQNSLGATAPPVGSVPVPENIDKYLAVIRQAIADADVFSEVPAYQHGTDRAAGAGATYGGLQLLMEASGRGLNDFFFNIDRFGLEPTVRMWVAWHNDYSTDPNIKGDVMVQATGHRGLMMKAMQLSAVREIMDRMQNPVDAVLLGPMLRIVLWRKFCVLNGILDIEDYLPREVETVEWQNMVKQILMAQAMQSGGGAAGGQNPMGTAPRPGGPAAEIPAPTM